MGVAPSSIALAGPSGSTSNNASILVERESTNPGGDTIWVQDGKHTVWGKAEIPGEVNDVLKDAGQSFPILECIV